MTEMTAMTEIRLDAPQAVEFADAATERDARLLVVGAYPAKGLTVTEGDLDRLVAHFSGPVPVKVEHVDTPLDPLGTVERVWRAGAALMGRVRFSADMASFLARRGAHKLSVGLVPAPDWRLLEASLTRRPHVPSATLLSEPPSSDGPAALLSETLLSETLLSDGEAAELARLRAERLEGQVTALKAAGRLAPAAEPFARALLQSPGVVTLSDGTAAGAGETFRRFLEAQPPVVALGEWAPGGRATTLSGGASGAAAFTAEEQEVLRRLGVSPEDVARTMAGGTMAGRPTPAR